jgi:hypothetical protein
MKRQSGLEVNSLAEFLFSSLRGGEEETVTPSNDGVSSRKLCSPLQGDPVIRRDDGSKTPPIAMTQKSISVPTHSARGAGFIGQNDQKARGNGWGRSEIFTELS